MTTKPKTQSQQIPVLAADIGNNTTKAILSNGTTVAYPSVIGYPERLLYQGSVITNGTQVSTVQTIELATERGNRFIGDLAIQQSKQKWSPQGRHREQTNTVKLLLLAALSELNVRGKIRLVTGLPVSDYTEAQRNELAQELQGQHTIARTGRDPVQVEIVDVDLKPQPLGTFYRQMFALQNGKAKVINQDLRKLKVGVLDIGGYTTDFALINAMRYQNSHSGSIETGMNHLYDLLVDKIRELHGIGLSRAEAEAAFKSGHLRIRGQKVKIAELAEQLLEVLAMAIRQRAVDLWSDGGTIDLIYVTGGGAVALGPYLTTTYPQLEIVERSHLANVEGFLYFGHILWS